jgi:hypothetical protein
MKKKKHEPRDSILCVWCTESELAKIRVAARAARLTGEEWALKVLLKTAKRKETQAHG